MALNTSFISCNLHYYVRKDQSLYKERPILVLRVSGNVPVKQIFFLSEGELVSRIY